MPGHDDTPSGQPEDIVIPLGTPHGNAAGYLRIAMVFAGLFFLGMIVLGSGALVIVGAIALFAIGLGWFVLSKTGPSKLIVGKSSVTLCEHGEAERRIAYDKIEAVDLRTRVLIHRFGRTKTKEEAQLLVFRLRGGESVEMPAPDEIDRERALQMIRRKLVG